MFKPTKSIGDEMIFNSSAVNFGASLPAYCRKPSVYLPLQDDVQKPGVQFARRDLRRTDVFGRIDRRQAGRDVLGEAYSGAGARFGADRLHRKPVAERDVVTRPG